MPVLLPGCPDWDYETVPGHQGVLRSELAVLLRVLRSGTMRVEVHGVDTRSIHKQLFRALTPATHRYFAGHYRGVNFPCLVDYVVVIPADPMVGLHYGNVQAAMFDLGQVLVEATTALDAAFATPNATLSPKMKLYFAVVATARAFQELLTIHPYANGNGHVARFLVWLLLGRYGYWPESWTIDPRPNATNYSAAISGHRRGATNDLERLILESIVGA